MMNNPYSDVRLAALNFVVNASLEANLQRLAFIGLDAETANLLRTLKADEIMKLSRIPAPMITIQFNQDQLKQQINCAKSESMKCELIDQLILMDASLAMMMSLTSISRAEYESRQEFLGITSTGAGRPKALTKTQELSVIDLWDKYKDLDEIERYHKVGLDTQIPLKQIWAYMMQGISAPQETRFSSVSSKSAKR